MTTRVRPFVMAISLGLATLAATPAKAVDNGYLMNVTLHAQEKMPGITTIPSQTMQHKICVKAGKFDAKAFTQSQTHGGCVVTHYKDTGKTVSFDMICNGMQKTTGHGVFHRGKGADFTGTLQTQSEAAGRSFTTDIQYTGKRVGRCNYKAP